MHDVVLKSDEELLESVGKANLQVVWNSTCAIFESTQHLQHIWDHSRSPWMLENLTVSQHAPWKNMRQVAAELAAKRQALSEAKFKIMKLQVEIEQDEACGRDSDDTFACRLRAIAVAEKKEQITFILEKFEGAMKEVANLGEIYEQLSIQLGSVTEAEFNAAELDSHLKRAICQSIRDVRVCGSITKGEQEYLEQCGVNPSKILAEIRKYLEAERSSASYGVGILWQFVAELVDKVKASTTELSIVKRAQA